MNSVVNIVVVQRVGGALDVLYIGDERGAAAAIVLNKIFYNPCYIKAVWFRAEHSGEAAVLWSWSQDQSKVTNVAHRV